MLRQQDIAVILAVHLHLRVNSKNISSVTSIIDTATDTITDLLMLSACVAAGIGVSLLGTDWCINPIVLRVEWWLDGKHFSSLNHMKSNCTSYNSCLQRVSRAKRLVSDICCARHCLTQLTWRSR